MTARCYFPARLLLDVVGPIQHVYTPANQRFPGMDYERRQNIRFPLAAPAEIIDVRTNSHLSGRAVDLSFAGCRLNVPGLFAAGTEIRVHIVHGEQMFTALGVVIHGQPSNGMGIRFTEIAPDQRERLEQWITAVARKQP